MSSLILRVATIASLTATLFTAGGCTLTPHYTRPDAPIPSTYASSDPQRVTALPLKWKEYFTDVNTQQLIGIALNSNRDLRIAMLNIEKTRNQYRIQRADVLPTVAAVASESMQHLPADLSPTMDAAFSRQYSATLGFSGFELDLFGRIRSLTYRALDLHYSVAEEAKTAQMSLVAEVAAMYTQLVADREIYDFMVSTRENRQQQLTMMEKRQKAGVASQLELNQAKSNYQEARAMAAQYEAQVKMDENYLGLLLGAPIPANFPDVRKIADITPLQDLPAGLPSTLLERRPDIQAAEFKLKAANANIGAARANFFPSIKLTGALGTMSVDYSDLFTPGQGGWNFLPQISLPIFDTGRNIANLNVAETDKDIAVASYEKTIQAAFREVADAIAQRDTMAVRLDSEKERAAAAQRSYVLAEKRYKAGVDNYLVFLDAQRTYFMAQQSYINTRLLREANALTLYKALGGGWQ